MGRNAEHGSVRLRRDWQWHRRRFHVEYPERLNDQFNGPVDGGAVVTVLARRFTRGVEHRAGLERLFRVFPEHPNAPGFVGDRGLLNLRKMPRQPAVDSLLDLNISQQSLGTGRRRLIGLRIVTRTPVSFCTVLTGYPMRNKKFLASSHEFILAPPGPKCQHRGAKSGFSE
jgi:hypothetical protein